MNHRVVLFLMVCNGMSADSIIAPALLTSLITLQQQRPCPKTLYLTTAGAIISGPYYWAAFNEESDHQTFRLNEIEPPAAETSKHFK